MTEPEHSAGDTVAVPAGEFWMGSDDGEPDERPRRRVWLDAYSIDKHEVTVAQYSQFARAAGRAMPAQPSWSDDDHPVVNVDWGGARDYCAWAGKRLPSEAEWEKAARGPDGRKHPWGNEPVSGERANYCDRRCALKEKDAGQDDGHAGTAPVGSYLRGASPYGALDMVGNVSEWAADWYGRTYYEAAPARNPRGPSSGAQRVVRGCGVLDNAGDCRVARRDAGNPDSRGDDRGFRCAGGSPRPAPR